MDRRAFIGAVAGGVLAAPSMARTQQPATPLVGFVRSSSLNTVPHLVAAFRQGLKESGYIDGQNVTIEFRSADDHYEQLSAIITELIRRQVTVLVANEISAQLAKGLTTTVTKPDIYALGTVTSSVSFVVIFIALGVIRLLQVRQMRHGSDAGKGMV